MEKTNFRKEKIPFTQVANSVLNDKELSAKAKGLYAYLYSKPDGWDFSSYRIALDFKENQYAINTGLQELEKQGYLRRQRLSSGRVSYMLKTQNAKINMGVQPKPQKPKCGKLQSAKIGPISNKEKIVIKKKEKEIKEKLEQVRKELMSKRVI